MIVALASLSYAVNALYQRRKLRGVSVFEVSLGQLAATAVFGSQLASILPAAKYDGEASPLAGTTATIDTIAFSDRNEQQTEQLA